MIIVPTAAQRLTLAVVIKTVKPVDFLLAVQNTAGSSFKKIIIGIKHKRIMILTRPTSFVEMAARNGFNAFCQLRIAAFTKIILVINRVIKIFAAVLYILKGTFVKIEQTKQIPFRISQKSDRGEQKIYSTDNNYNSYQSLMLFYDLGQGRF